MVRLVTASEVETSLIGRNLKFSQFSVALFDAATTKSKESFDSREQDFTLNKRAIRGNSDRIKNASSD